MHEAIRNEWNEYASGWERWDNLVRAMVGPFNEVTLDGAALSSGDTVLDIASGTGEPAVPAAHRVGNEGHVTASDLSANMLAVARVFGLFCSTYSLNSSRGSVRWGGRFVSSMKRLRCPCSAVAMSVWPTSTSVSCPGSDSRWKSSDMPASAL